MRNKSNKHLGIEIEDVIHYKLRYIAKYEGRSISGQIRILILNYITQFEKEHGEIKRKDEHDIH